VIQKPVDSRGRRRGRAPHRAARGRPERRHRVRDTGTVRPSRGGHSVTGWLSRDLFHGPHPRGTGASSWSFAGAFRGGLVGDLSTGFSTLVPWLSPDGVSFSQNRFTGTLSHGGLCLSGFGARGPKPQGSCQGPCHGVPSHGVPSRRVLRLDLKDRATGPFRKRTFLNATLAHRLHRDLFTGTAPRRRSDRGTGAAGILSQGLSDGTRRGAEGPRSRGRSSEASRPGDLATGPCRRVLVEGHWEGAVGILPGCRRDVSRTGPCQGQLVRATSITPTCTLK